MAGSSALAQRGESRPWNTNATMPHDRHRRSAVRDAAPTDGLEVLASPGGKLPRQHPSVRQLVENAGPTARTLAKRGEVILFVGRVNAVIVEAEAHEQTIHPKRLLEGGDDRNRA